MLTLLLIPVMNKIIGSLNISGGKNIRSNLSSSMFCLLTMFYLLTFLQSSCISEKMYFFNLFSLKSCFLEPHIGVQNLSIQQFQDRIPGQYCLKNIMRRGCSVRLLSTSNAFIIYAFKTK